MRLPPPGRARWIRPARRRGRCEAIRPRRRRAPSARRPSSPDGLGGLPSCDAGGEVVELGAIGRGIALDEEMRRLLAVPAGLVGDLDARQPDVLGPRHALGAMHLEALVVAVGRAPRAADLAEPARAGPEDHQRRVDVAEPADLGLDQAAAGGEHLDRLLAEQPAREVEVVDHHVAVQPARDLDVGGRRRAGVARGDRDQLEPADPASSTARLSAPKLPSKRRLKPIISGTPASARDREAGVDPRARQIDRLLAQDRLAGARRRLDQVGMGVGRARDQHRRDRRIRQRLLGGRDQSAGRLGHRPRRGRVHVDHVAQPVGRMARQVVGVHPPDAAGPELTDLDHRASPTQTPATRRHYSGQSEPRQARANGGARSAAALFAATQERGFMPARR